MPRVISGTAGGIPLKMPDGDKTRPTAARTKESLFSIIQTDIHSSTVLDLFAGSGALGIEALSRGAKKAVFVEADKSTCDIILNNLAKTKLHTSAEVVRMSVDSAIPFLASKRVKFGLVFIDAPYLEELVLKTLQMLNDNAIIINSGLAVVEHHKNEILPERIGCLHLERKKEYGDTTISFYVLHANGEHSQV